jgi:hypothetical protein
MRGSTTGGISGMNSFKQGSDLRDRDSNVHSRYALQRLLAIRQDIECPAAGE